MRTCPFTGCGARFAGDEPKIARRLFNAHLWRAHAHERHHGDRNGWSLHVVMPTPWLRAEPGRETGIDP